MGSISPVDSAIGGLDHVWASTFQYFSHCTSYPLNGALSCLLGKNWTWSLTLRTCRCLALWALSKFCFCFSWSLMSLCQIWCMLTHFDGLERTVPCAGHPCRISAGDGRSVMGVSHSWSSALAWALGDSISILLGILDFLHHGLNESIGLMEMGWWCGVHEVEFTGKLPKLLTIEWGSIVRHDNGGYAFSCKGFPQVSNGLEMMCRCHWKHVRELAEVICYYEVLFSQMV